MDWKDEAAEQIEAVTRDPLADAVTGTVRLVAVSAPSGRGRYQEATLELVAEASGIESRVIHTAAVFDTRAWPTVGLVLPARISRGHAEALEVDWSALPR